MRLSSGFIPASLFTGIALLALSPLLFSQEPDSVQIITFSTELPETPQPQLEVASAGSQTQPTAVTTSNQTSAAQGTSSSQTSTQQSETEKSQHDKAAEQLKQQEHNRVAGVMAAFNTTQNQDAAPLSPGQKFQLFFKSASDPWPFGLSAVVAGIGQADDSYPAWGQGMQGYAKRFGGAYSDYFIGNFFGNAVLPTLWHEDPRYYQKGTGSAGSRALWAATSTAWCKRDNGKWGPNYANVIGNLIGAAIARVYYPPSERTVGNTITDGLTVSVEGIVGAEVIEFWPDAARHFKRKRDEKAARLAAQADAAAH